ncbi:hypothetical protein TYRP_009893 [Tyrophagus putrescentiae]|nr:hypothetical protein TYRP_009893 [Tyrophagus putrescentiae]
MGVMGRTSKLMRLMRGGHKVVHQLLAAVHVDGRRGAGQVVGVHRGRSSSTTTSISSSSFSTSGVPNDDSGGGGDLLIIFNFFNW